MNNYTDEYVDLLEKLKSHVKHYVGRMIVIKYGGNAMTDETLKAGFAQDVVALKQLGLQPVVVHGGGPQINHWLDRIGKEGHFIQGMRVTDTETMSVVEMVLCGQVGKEIASLINLHGGKALGISGRDGHFIRAKKLFLDDGQGKPVDIGQVGEVEVLDSMLLKTLAAGDMIPVVAPIGAGEHGEAYNINADLVAGKVAESLNAERLMLLTNTPGVLDKDGNLIPHLNRSRIDTLAADGTIHGGMLPKLRGALDAANHGVGAVQIIDGRVPHALLRAFLPDGGAGTLITVA